MLSCSITLSQGSSGHITLVICPQRAYNSSYMPAAALRHPAHRGEICGNEAHLHHIPIGRVAHTVLGRQDHQPVEWAPVNAFLALFRPFGTS